MKYLDKMPVCENTFLSAHSFTLNTFSSFQYSYHDIPVPNSSLIHILSSAHSTPLHVASVQVWCWTKAEAVLFLFLGTSYLPLNTRMFCVSRKARAFSYLAAVGIAQLIQLLRCRHSATYPFIQVRCLF